MSVAIATMGKYIPRFVQQVTVESIGGGSSYGWAERKPQIIVNSVADEDDIFRISVVKVTEWS